MSEPVPLLCLAMHGETAWSLSGQHTGLTHLALTGRGERNARRLGARHERSRPVIRLWNDTCHVERAG